MDPQQDLVILIRDVIDATHGLATSLEKIVTSFERLSGRIAEEKELSVVASQFAGLHQRAEDMLKSLPAFAGDRKRAWTDSAAGENMLK